MCLGIPGKVVALVDGQPDLAHVEVAGLTRPVNVGLLKDEALRRGEWVLIHAGFAMERIDEATARRQLSFLEEYTMEPPPAPPPPWTADK
jgi:hydrogenase expression/formation protein HypC